MLLQCQDPFRSAWCLLSSDSGFLIQRFQKFFTQLQSCISHLHLTNWTQSSFSTTQTSCLGIAIHSSPFKAAKASTATKSSSLPSKYHGLFVAALTPSLYYIVEEQIGWVNWAILRVCEFRGEMKFHSSFQKHKKLIEEKKKTNHQVMSYQTSESSAVPISSSCLPSNPIVMALEKHISQQKVPSASWQYVTPYIDLAAFLYI